MIIDQQREFLSFPLMLRKILLSLAYELGLYKFTFTLPLHGSRNMRKENLAIKF